MKTELSKLDKVKKVLGMEIDLAEMKLDDGVTVIEAEVFEAGQPVMIKTEDGQSIPMPVGEYGLEDGMMLVVSEEGVIGEIKEAAPEQPEEEEPVAAAESPEEKPVAKKVVEAITKETHFTAEEKETLLARIDALEAKLSEQTEETVDLKEEKKEPIKPIAHNPESGKEQKVEFKFAQDAKPSLGSRVRSQIYGK